MREEERIERRRVDDTRSHACLYFIPPTGAGLRYTVSSYRSWTQVYFIPPAGAGLRYTISLLQELDSDILYPSLL